MTEDAKIFLDKLKDIKDPSRKTSINGKEFKFEVLTFKQQRDLISTIAEGNLASLKFQKVLNDILIENFDKELLLHERSLAAVSLRRESLGASLKIGDTTIDLNQIAKKVDLPLSSESVVESSGIRVSMDNPSLQQENKIISALLELVKNDNNAAKNISDIYTYEIVKYINTISFGGENTLAFLNLPVKTRINIVENLPISLNKKIVDFIQKIKEAEKELLTVTDSKGQTVQLDIDVTFFDS